MFNLQHVEFVNEKKNVSLFAKNTAVEVIVIFKGEVWCAATFEKKKNPLNMQFYVSEETLAMPFYD
jgi:hypothetical protein